MQERIKEFIIEKKDTIIFVGLLLLVFTTILVVANSSLRNINSDDDIGVVAPDEDDDKSDTEAPEPKASRPVIGEDFVVIRIFYDDLVSREDASSAIIDTGNRFVASQGKSFATADNQEFDVVSILPGRILDIIPSEKFEGYTVLIQHDESVVSKYMSLSQVSEDLVIGEYIDKGTVIGVAGTSTKDVSAGTHVHLRVLVNDEPINPIHVFGRTLNEINYVK